MKRMVVILLACLLFASCKSQTGNSMDASSNVSSGQTASSAIDGDDLADIPVSHEQEGWDYSTLDDYAVAGFGEAVLVASFTPCDTRIQSIEVWGFIGGGNSGDNGVNIVLYDSANWMDLTGEERGILAHEVLKSARQTMSGYRNISFGTQGFTEDGTLIFSSGGVASDGASITLWDGTGAYKEENAQIVSREEMEQRARENR